MPEVLERIEELKAELKKAYETDARKVGDKTALKDFMIVHLWRFVDDHPVIREEVKRRALFFARLEKKSVLTEIQSLIEELREIPDSEKVDENIKIGKEIQRSYNKIRHFSDIYRPVSYNEWATRIVWKENLFDFYTREYSPSGLEERLNSVVYVFQDIFAYLNIYTEENKELVNKLCRLIMEVKGTFLYETQEQYMADFRDFYFFAANYRKDSAREWSSISEEFDESNIELCRSACENVLNEIKRYYKTVDKVRLVVFEAESRVMIDGENISLSDTLFNVFLKLAQVPQKRFKAKDLDYKGDNDYNFEKRITTTIRRLKDALHPHDLIDNHNSEGYYLKLKKECVVIQ